MSEPKADDEMREAIEQITQDMFVALSEWQAGSPVDWHSTKVKGRQELLDLFNTEKRKWAEYVVGDWEPYIKQLGHNNEPARLRNKLRKEQRKRNV